MLCHLPIRVELHSPCCSSHGRKINYREVLNLQVKQTLVFEILRNGNRYRVFSARQTAVNYLAAALDLDPDSTWSLREVLLNCG